jgi:hypothetical protein
MFFSSAPVPFLALNTRYLLFEKKGRLLDPF